MTKSTVLVAVFDTMSDWELGYATAHIRRPSWQQQPGRYGIVTVGVTRDPVVSAGGMRIIPDVALADVDPAGSAMLVLAGGDTWADDAMAPFRAAACTFLDQGVPVAAICGATFGLALEGLLDERVHTSNAREYLAMSGYAGDTLYRDELAVDAAGLITASGVAPVQFARAIFERLELYRSDVCASWYKLYGEQDQNGFFELMSA